jgi:glycosyltransferase involved in cell wall biosynthesis
MDFERLGDRGNMHKPIRVLQVVTIMNRGGLETMLMNYYRQIDRSQIQFDFIVHRNEKGHYDDEILNLGGRIYRMPPIRPGSYRQYFKQLETFFSQHSEYKVVHAHNNENSSFVLRAAQRAGVPCRIAHSHLSDLGIDLKLPFRLYARYVMKDYPTEYFACSRKAGQWLFGKEKMERVKVLNNAVNVSDFRFHEVTRMRIRKELGLENQLVIGHVGRFNKQKNHDYLIDIFNEVVAKHPNSTLLLIGEGDREEQIKQKVFQYGLESKVLFLGVRSDIAQLMQGMDLFLFPSLFEGLPVVLVEAQAAGLKCMVSDSITKESDLTGRLEFISLQEQPEQWAAKILQSTYEHLDTTDQLRTHGYDSFTTSKWLSDYYSSYYQLAK